MEKLLKNAENLCQHLNKKCNIHSITGSCNEKSKTIRLMFGANSLRYVITASLHTNEGEISIVSPISIDNENQATLNSLLYILNCMYLNVRLFVLSSTDHLIRSKFRIDLINGIIPGSELDKIIYCLEEYSIFVKCVLQQESFGASAFQNSAKQFALLVREAYQNNPMSIPFQDNEYYMYFHYLIFYSNLVDLTRDKVINTDLSPEQLSEWEKLISLLDDEESDEE